MCRGLELLWKLVGVSATLRNFQAKWTFNMKSHEILGKGPQSIFMNENIWILTKHLMNFVQPWWGWGCNIDVLTVLGKIFSVVTYIVYLQWNNNANINATEICHMSWYQRLYLFVHTGYNKRCNPSRNTKIKLSCHQMTWALSYYCDMTLSQEF